MKKIVPAISGIALALALPAVAQAKDEADSAAIIVVTAKSLEETLPQELARYGSDLIVLSSEQIQDTGALDVATALARVPGLYVMPGAGPFDYVDVSLQGSRTADVLWTLDGIRLNNRLYSGTSPNDTLPSSMIERIEVLKGGESLFYGTQATAGIINVVTRSFSDDFNGQVNASVDSRAATSADGYARGSLGRHKFVVYASHNQSEGFRQYSTTQPSATDHKRGYNIWSVGGKYQIELSDGLQLNAQYQHTDAKLDNLSATRVNSSRNDRNEEIASVRLDYTNNDTVQLFLKGYFHDWKTAYVRILNDLDGAGNLTGTTTTLYPAGTFWGYKDYGGSAVVKLHLHKGLEYLLGYDFQTFSGRDDVFLIGDLKEKVHAGIFQVRTTDELSSKGRLAAGARYNKTGGNKKTVWNVSGRYDFSPAFFAEANGGTSFVLPSAEQLYLIDPCCEVGNPNLKPEQSLNLNASVGGRIGAEGSAINWQATYFYRRITDLIDYAYPDNPAFPNGTFENVNGKVFVHGFEILADARVGNGLNLSASYTRNSSRTEGSDRQRDRTPRDLFKGSIFYRPEDKPFGGNLTVNWTGDAYSKPSGFARQNYGNYAVVNAGLFVHPDGQARRHRLSVNLENIFNNEYASRGYGSAPIDGSTDRFLYFSRGTPRTLRVSYGLAF
jgi:vitamin B12 transporter